MHIPISLLKTQNSFLNFPTALIDWSFVQSQSLVIGQISSLWWAGSRSCCGTVARWATSSTLSSTPCTSTAPPSSASTLGGLFFLTMLIWLLETKNDVHNVLKVVGNCARLLVNDRQWSRGGKIKRGSRSSSSYLVSFPILVFSFITVFLVCDSCPYFSTLPYNFLLFSSSFSLSSLPFPSLLVSSVIILPIFFYHYFLLCLCSSTFSLSLTVSWLCWKQEVTIPARSLSWPASRTNTMRCLQSIWRCGTLESTLPKFPTRQ